MLEMARTRKGSAPCRMIWSHLRQDKVLPWRVSGILPVGPLHVKFVLGKVRDEKERSAVLHSDCLNILDTRKNLNIPDFNILFRQEE